MNDTIIQKTKDTLVKAASSFTDDHIEAYKRAIDAEKNERAKWAMQTILDNAYAAKEEVRVWMHVTQTATMAVFLKYISIGAFSQIRR